MKRLTTTFQGMEFIKILLGALGWNAFWPCKTGTAAQSPVGKLGTSSETSARQTVFRGPCIITDYSIHCPTPAPETTSGLGEKTSL